MFEANDLVRFAEVCANIGNEVAGDDGFVPIRSLLSRFHTRLFMRPLLVEGMLASIEDTKGETSMSNKWAVLLDSETYPISEQQLIDECSENPLPSRLRNTIAHELVHSLAFRPSEFGIRLRKNYKNGSAVALVKEIENETERLSPLLLWPDKALSKFLAGRNDPLSVEELNRICRRMGISRYVLINRLHLLHPANKFRYSDGLKNMAIGIGSWRDRRTAVLRSWPVFVNFDRNIVPSFLRKISRQDFTPAKILFSNDAFAMCGGTEKTIEITVDAGTEAFPTTEKMLIRCSVERVRKKNESEFLYVVHKQSLEG